MAKVEVKQEMIKKMVEIEVAGPKTYTLNLTEEELKTIYALVGRTTGSSATSDRGYSDEIYRAIEKATGKSCLDFSYYYNFRSDVKAHFEDFK